MSSRRSCSCPCAHGIGLRDLENGLYIWDSPVGASVGGEGHVRVGCLALQTHKPSQRCLNASNVQGAKVSPAPCE